MCITMEMNGLNKRVAIQLATTTSPTTSSHPKGFGYVEKTGNGHVGSVQSERSDDLTGMVVVDIHGRIRRSVIHAAE